MINIITSSKINSLLMNYLYLQHSEQHKHLHYGQQQTDYL